MNNTLNTTVVTTQSSISCDNNHDLSNTGCMLGVISTAFCMLRSTEPKLLITHLIVNSLCGCTIGALANKLLDSRIIITKEIKETKTVPITQQPID